jgi:hypothetical protein
MGLLYLHNYYVIFGGPIFLYFLVRLVFTGKKIFGFFFFANVFTPGESQAYPASYSTVPGFFLGGKT